VHFLLREFVHARRSGPDRFDFTLLAEFHESGKGDDRYSFAADQHHVPLFAHNFMKLFLADCTPLFGGRFPLQGGGGRQVFASEFFHGEFSHLALLEQNLSRVSFLRNGFTCEDYLRLRGAARSHATPSELQIIQALEEMGRIFADLGLKLGHVALSGRTPENDDPPPLDLSLLTRPAFPVPGWEDHLAGPAFLKGRMVREAIPRLAGLCLLVALYLGNPRLEEAFRQGQETNERIATLRDALERVADVVTFNTLRRELGL
jgi:hypothetical protein